MDQQQLDLLTKESHAYLQNAIATAQARYGIGSYDDFLLDQTTGRITFTRGGTPRLSCRFQAVGSLSTTTDTWLWSWANDDLLDSVKDEIAKVREFGEQNDIGPLVTAQWPAAEPQAWAVTAISAKLLRSACAYRCPSRSGHLFVLLQDLELIA